MSPGGLNSVAGGFDEGLVDRAERVGWLGVVVSEGGVVVAGVVWLPERVVPVDSGAELGEDPPHAPIASIGARIAPRTKLLDLTVITSLPGDRGRSPRYERHGKGSGSGA